MPLLPQGLALVAKKKNDTIILTTWRECRKENLRPACGNVPTRAFYLLVCHGDHEVLIMTTICHLTIVPWRDTHAMHVDCAMYSLCLGLMD